MCIWLKMEYYIFLFDDLHKAKAQSCSLAFTLSKCNLKITAHSTKIFMNIDAGSTVVGGSMNDVTFSAFS